MKLDAKITKRIHPYLYGQWQGENHSGIGPGFASRRQGVKDTDRDVNEGFRLKRTKKPKSMEPIDQVGAVWE